MDDYELLREYVRSRSQEAFRQLVDRHLPMVFCAARRMVGDAHLAEEVAQSVFTALAQKAGGLGPSAVVGGWLYNTTRNLAMHAVRTEQRRREREQAAAAMQTLETTDDKEQVLERLEPAMAELEESQRAALVLRYFQERSLREVGQELGVSEDAARMRVNRALEQLRAALANQGVTVTSVLLAAALAASTATALPAGLAAGVTATALAGTAAAVTTAAHTALATMFNTKVIAALVGAAVLTGTGTYLVQQRQLQRLQAERQSLVSQQAQARAAQEMAATTVQASKDELERLQKENAELLRLRNEVGQLRREREAQQQRTSQASQPATGAGQTAGKAGRYISQEQLAFVGYATPEAALQSMAWAMMNGTYEQANAGLAPELLNSELKDEKGREQFEANRAKAAPLFKGMQILARKALGEDRVELKVNWDVDPLPNGQGNTPPVMIQPMVKVGNEWKLGGSTRAYRPSWEESGQVEAAPQ